jgi:hypothetical protein
LSPDTSTRYRIERGNIVLEGCATELLLARLVLLSNPGEAVNRMDLLVNTFSPEGEGMKLIHLLHIWHSVGLQIQGNTDLKWLQALTSLVDETVRANLEGRLTIEPRATPPLLPP